VISLKVKIQLAFFVAITLVGTAFVGARYAQLDEWFSDQTYTVDAHFAASGGIFTGAEVTYRGVGVGRVGALDLTDAGVDVALEIENEHDDIPADVDAVVANRSAVGEQYVDLQPATDAEPYLDDGDEIALDRTSVPLTTTKLLIDIDELVNSVNRPNLRTTVTELGKAFGGAGEDLGTIIDTGNAFIEAADRNFGLTVRLIRESRRVLDTQIDSAPHIRDFARDLALFSDTLAASDADLRLVIDEGSVAASAVRRLIDENADALASLFGNLATINEIVAVRIDGLREVLVLYPYVVEGGYTVVAKDPFTGLYDAHFGLVFTSEPHVCNDGYQTTNKRPPANLSEVPLNVIAHCEEPQTLSNARGAQHAPNYNRASLVGAYDPATGRLQATSRVPGGDVVSVGGGAEVFGEDAWKWLLLGPLGSR
jgi:phospholipid/cholesterol/gamma-HCH transport system substrate-binding protein